MPLSAYGYDGRCRTAERELVRSEKAYLADQLRIVVRCLHSSENSPPYIHEFLQPRGLQMMVDIRSDDISEKLHVTLNAHQYALVRVYDIITYLDSCIPFVNNEGKVVIKDTKQQLKHILTIIDLGFDKDEWTREYNENDWEHLSTTIVASIMRALHGDDGEEIWDV
ncbi:hypothetical protein T484DRAFT_1758537 [Baffinella frigidus]|nr:hypothetical protein T484DRAFT_1758537 [Cryptophyta sp. CCMP2293]